MPEEPSWFKSVPRAGMTPGLYWARLREGLRRRWGRWHTFLAGRLRRYDRWREVNWTRVERLVFVCTGNICRSPYAEHLAISLGVKAVSCGISAKGGAAADPLAIKVGGEFGIDLNGHRSAHVSSIALSHGDLVVVMDIGHLEALKCKTGENSYQLTLLGLWDGRHPVEISDPYGRSQGDFHACFQRITQSLRALLEARNSAGVCVPSQFPG